MISQHYLKTDQLMAKWKKTVPRNLVLFWKY